MQPGDGRPAQAARVALVAVSCLVMADLFELGGRVLAVTGQFGERTLVELPTDAAEEMFDPQSLLDARKAGNVEAVERELGRIRELDPQLAESALAASALTLAEGLESPYNSLTAKSNAAKEIRENMRTLWALMPPARPDDDIERALNTPADGPPTA